MFVFWCKWIVGIVTRCPLVLQLHKTESGTQEYAEFLHQPRRKFTDFGMTVTLHTYTGKLPVLTNHRTASIFLWFSCKRIIHACYYILCLVSKFECSRFSHKTKLFNYCSCCAFLVSTLLSIIYLTFWHWCYSFNVND